MSKKLTKAIFPVAGLGSRFLPATKANPKEMMPIVDKPLIQYAVEEAIRAGFTDMVFITSSRKRSIEDHFDSNFELEANLLQKNKQELYNLVRAIAPKNINFTYIRQNEPQGLGHAILCAKHVIGDEGFAVLLADDLIEDSVNPCLSAMAEHYLKNEQSLVAVQEVSEHEVHKYGVVDVEGREKVAKIKGIVEKPRFEDAPSSLVAVGRYIFTPEIFTHLENTQEDNRGEIQLTDGIAGLLLSEQVNSFNFKGKRYDCGSKLGYMQAVVEYGVKHYELGNVFKEYLLEMAQELIKQESLKANVLNDD